MQEAQNYLKSGQARAAMQTASEFAERVGKISTGLSLSLVGVATALEYYSTGSPTKATGTFVAEAVDASLGAFITVGAGWGAAAGTSAAGVGALPGAIIGGLAGAGLYLGVSQTDSYQDAKTSVKTGTESLLDGFDWAAAEQAFAPYVEMQNSPGLSYQLGTRFGEWLRGR